MCFKSFGKGKNIKATLGFELVTYIFVVKALTHSETMLGNTFRKENIKHYFILLFISIWSMSQFGDVQYHLKDFCKDTTSSYIKISKSICQW